MGSLDRAWRGLLLGLMTLFVVNIGLMIAAVATSSFARRWLGTWLPEGWTTTWYTAAWKEFQLGSVLWVTVEVVLAVVLLSLLIGVPAAYTLARRNFPGKRALMLLFLLPLMVPPITYGIPLATVLYKVASRRHDLRRDPRQPDSGGAVRDPGDDAVHRADRSEPRIGGARVRRGHRARVPARAGAAARARASSPRRCWCWCARSRCSSSRS